MFERFTDTTRRVVVLAQEEARDRADGRIGTEHLLLGLLAAPDSPAHPVLARHGVTEASVRSDLARRAPGGADDRDALRLLGIDLDEVRRRAEAAFGPGALERTRAGGHGRRSWMWGHIPFHPEAKKVLELALRESIRRGDRHIGAEHVLLGLLHSDTGLGHDRLGAHGVTLRDARAAFDTPDAATG